MTTEQRIVALKMRLQTVETEQRRLRDALVSLLQAVHPNPHQICAPTWEAIRSAEAALRQEEDRSTTPGLKPGA